MKTFESRMAAITKMAASKMSKSSEYHEPQMIEYVLREPALTIAQEADQRVAAQKALIDCLFARWIPEIPWDNGSDEVENLKKLKVAAE